MESVKVQPSTFQSQSQVPGSFQQTWNTQVNITTYGIGEHRLGASSVASYNLNTTKALLDVNWLNTDNDTVNYKQQLTYTSTSPSLTEDQLEVLNYPFLSLYYQMSHMPQFMSVW